jgi:hypothetical protein
MQYEARFGVAVVRYTSVRSGFWGPVWRTDGESTGTDGGSESGYADRSRGFFAADLTFHDPCSVPSSLVTRILDTKSVGDPLVGQHQPACGCTIRVVFSSTATPRPTQSREASRKPLSSAHPALCSAPLMRLTGLALRCIVRAAEAGQVLVTGLGRKLRGGCGQMLGARVAQLVKGPALLVRVNRRLPA